MVAWLASVQGTPGEVLMISDDAAVPPRNTILMSVAFFTFPLNRVEEYQKATAVIVDIFKTNNMLDCHDGFHDVTALAMAASTGNVRVAQLLLEAGASTSPSAILNYAPPGRFADTGEDAMGG